MKGNNSPHFLSGAYVSTLFVALVAAISSRPMIDFLTIPGLILLATSSVFLGIGIKLLSMKKTKSTKETHHVIEFLNPKRSYLRTDVKGMLLKKFNQKTGLKWSSSQFSQSDNRWFFYHVCYDYALKAGAGTEILQNRFQFDQTRSLRTALPIGALLGLLIAVSIMGQCANAGGLSPLFVLWPTLVLAVVSWLSALFGAEPLKEHQTRSSRRLAGSVYESFLAS